MESSEETTDSSSPIWRFTTNGLSSAGVCSIWVIQ